MGDNDETYVYEAADYEVTFRHPKKYTIAATGTQHSVQDGTTITGKKLREFAAVLSDDFCRLDAKTGSITISILGSNYEKNQSYYKYSMQLAKEAVRIFFGKNRFVSVFTVKNRALFYEQRNGISGALHDWHAGCEGL